VTDRRSPDTSSRKQPKQARSTDLVAVVLDAAVQVLAKEGAQGFTTARVAEKAGVSVGSLYQYFPNKAAILFRLQSDEWRQTTELLRGILEDVQRPPLERLRILVHAFIRSECEEAAVRVALDDAAPLYRDAPEAREARLSGTRMILVFMREVLPETAEATRARRSDLNDAEPSGKALLGIPSDSRGDRSLLRRHGRYVLLLPHGIARMTLGSFHAVFG
jgi:AcrR family transcriptional regulator